MKYDVLETTAVCIVHGEPKLSIFPPTLSEAVKSRYRFVDFPKEASDFTSGGGFTFRYGNFKDFIIDRMTVYNDGILVSASVTSDQLDEVIADFMDALKSDFNLVADPGSTVSMYNSKIEIELNHGISQWFERFQSISDSLASSARSKGIDVRSYELAGFSFAGEGSSEIKPGRFSFERRVDRLFDENVFFSEAPLSTPEHLGLIQNIENLFG